MKTKDGASTSKFSANKSSKTKKQAQNHINKNTIKKMFQNADTIEIDQDDDTIYDSANDTVVEPMMELPKILSVMQARKKSLEEKKKKILEIGDESIKDILLDLVSDISKCVEDSDKIVQCHNALLMQCKDDSKTILSNQKSINNLTQGIGNLKDGMEDVKNKMQTLEVKDDCRYDSYFLQITFVDENEVDEIENGTIGPRQKFNKIMSALKIVPPRDVIDSNLMTVRRFRNGSKKAMKILKVRFADSLTAGKVFAQVVKHNKNLQEHGRRNEVKYYAEVPTSKNVWSLKRICLELRKDNILQNVRGCDRGVIVSYKCFDDRDSRKEIIKSTMVTCESDIDDLRIKLNADDAFIPVKEKYNNDYWIAKRKSTGDNKGKRIREFDENEELNIAKKASSTPDN